MKEFDVTQESVTVTYHGLGEKVEVYDDLDELQAAMADATFLHVLLDALIKRAAEFAGKPKLTDKLKVLAERIVAESVAKGLEDPPALPLLTFPIPNASGGTFPFKSNGSMDTLAVDSSLLGKLYLELK